MSLIRVWLGYVRYAVEVGFYVILCKMKPERDGACDCKRQSVRQYGDRLFNFFISKILSFYIAAVKT